MLFQTGGQGRLSRRSRAKSDSGALVQHISSRTRVRLSYCGQRRPRAREPMRASLAVRRISIKSRQTAATFGHTT